MTQTCLWLAPSYGPKGQGNLAQGLPGLPWVNFPNRMGPEGSVQYGEDCLIVFRSHSGISASGTPSASALDTFFWLPG
jgi:hypothetical protein